MGGHLAASQSKPDGSRQGAGAIQFGERTCDLSHIVGSEQIANKRCGSLCAVAFDG
jgi:hypothetical protein